MPKENPSLNLPNNQPTPGPNPETPAATPDNTPTPMPSPILNSKVQKPKNQLLPVVIILAVLTLIGLGTSIYFGIQSSSQASEISNLKSDLDHKGSNNPSSPSDQPPITTTPDTPSDNSTANTTEILAKVPENLIIKSDTIYTTSASYKEVSSYSMSYSWNFHDNSGDITIYWDTLEASFNYNHKTGTETITDFGPTTGTIIDIIFGRFGNGMGDECFLFLMSDGSVEYVPYFLAIKENNFRSRGKLGNINNVIKFYNITNAHTPQAFSGYRTVLAQRADGTIYDLASTISNLNIMPTN